MKTNTTRCASHAAAAGAAHGASKPVHENSSMNNSCSKPLRAVRPPHLADLRHARLSAQLRPQLLRYPAHAAQAVVQLVQQTLGAVTPGLRTTAMDKTSCILTGR